MPDNAHSYFVLTKRHLSGESRTQEQHYVVLCTEKGGKKSTYSLDESSSDFRSLGIQCNSHRSVGDRIRGEALCSFSHVLDCALMILARKRDGNFNLTSTLPLCTPKTAQATIQRGRTAA